MASIESMDDAATDERTYRLLLFEVAGRLCACDLTTVREIIAMRPATRLPGAPAWIRGLINLRGTLLTVVDLPERFGGGARDGGSIIVAEAAGKTFGIGVDAVREVQALTGEALEPVETERSVCGIVTRLAHLGAKRAETALVCDVESIARQALVIQEYPV